MLRAAVVLFGRADRLLPDFAQCLLRVAARAGTLTAGREWFKPWRTISAEALADTHMPEFEEAWK